ncbi:S41 family peptidase [Tenacibaculum sp. TC6]|uniref:S41 family peptidase n=1 Tax=Tenacibaculum sp. TC6 TaxID=3423223 RepID=UPI003D3645CF
MNFKKIIVLNIWCMLYVFQANAFQNEFQQTTKYKQFGLVWGLLKYHDPDISKGKYDWNAVFLENINKIEIVKNQGELNNFLFGFISEFCSKNELSYKKQQEELFEKNKDYEWIQKLPFTHEIKKKLEALSNNSDIGNYYPSISKLAMMPSFKNETEIANFNSANKSHRLLTFFSFWNAIQYYNVNKYLMDIPWYEQIDNYIPHFLVADSTLKYEKVKSEFIAALNDSHAFYVSPVVNDSLFQYKPAFGVKMVNDTLVVNSIRNKALAQVNNIKLGDLIVEVNDLDIPSSLKKRVGSIISHSNNSFLKKWATWIFFNQYDSIKIKLKRGKDIESRYIKLYNNIQTEDYSYLKPKQILTKKQLVNDGIGYINLGSISKEELKAAFKKYATTKAIIIDLRNYPKNILERDIVKYLYPTKKRFIKVLFPLKGQPSYANFEKTALSYIKDPFIAGSKNSNYYKGKVILLVNHTTQSKAEFIGMAIQAAPNCITVGEQTAGSVMNITTYKLPDGTPVNFTSLGAFYPNGDGAQKKGLKIDYVVNETITNFLNDPYMIKAIELIEKKD